MGMVKLNSIPSLESVLYLGYKLDTKLFLDICITLATWQEPTNTKKNHEMDFFCYFFKDFLVQPNCFEWEFIYAISQNGNAVALNGNLCIIVNFNKTNVE